MTVSVVRAVLEAHPLTAGVDREAGLIVCSGCRLVLGDATQHLLQAVEAALEPGYVGPAVPERSPGREHRESRIVWPVSGVENAGAA